MTNLIICDTIKLLNNPIKLESKDKILGIYDIDTRLKVKVFKTTPMGSRKEKVWK